jgi:hypothetical protein
MPIIKKVRNWKDYNTSLKKRGEIIFNMTEEYFESLYYKDPQKKGGIRKYNKEMFHLILAVKVTFRLPLRQAVGAVFGILSRMFNIQDPQVPDFGHVCREISKLNLEIKRYTNSEDNIALCFDSTGVSIHSLSGWHHAKHGMMKKLSAGERWYKVHVMMDLNSGEILGCKLTKSNVHDMETLQPLIDKLAICDKEKIDSIIGDGAYDAYATYEIAHDLKVEVKVPPCRVAKAQHELAKKRKPLEYLNPRDEKIDYIRKFESFEEGLASWKKTSGYHARSKIEATMLRIKKTFGFNMHFKKDPSRQNEFTMKMSLLNKMLQLGKAEYYT